MANSEPDLKEQLIRSLKESSFCSAPLVVDALKSLEDPNRRIPISDYRDVIGLLLNIEFHHPGFLFEKTLDPLIRTMEVNSVGIEHKPRRGR